MLKSVLFIQKKPKESFDFFRLSTYFKLFPNLQILPSNVYDQLYQNFISETENIQLRQTIQQIRNTDESFQYELFKVAHTKGYYNPV